MLGFPRLRQVKPVAGMKSPADQWAVMIDVTNACPHDCSNCLRFTRLVTKPFTMNLPTFQRAVDSMAGYPGVVAMMGGEPTLHPQFPELARYFREHFHPELPARDGDGKPIEDFGKYASSRCLGLGLPGKRALVTSLGPGYYRHFETIQDTFDQQGINTHRSTSMHQAVLTTRREARMCDREWFAARDRCWVQRLWSASITPKGAYFCEIAGALDMLYDSLTAARRAELGMPASGGWPIEPGWWRRKPAEFREQLGWCEFCGAALQTPATQDSDGVQQVSLWHAARLAEIGSPMSGSPKLQILGRKQTPPRRRDGAEGDPDWYIPPADKSRRTACHDLHPQRIEAIIVSVDCGDELRRTLPGRAGQFDHTIVVTAAHDEETQRIAEAAGATVVVTDVCYDDHAAFNKGAMLNAGMRALKYGDWVVFSDADIFFAPGWREGIGGLVLNPGCLYHTRRWYLRSSALVPDRSLLTQGHLRDPIGSDGPWGYFQLWNMRASCLASQPLRYPLCFPDAGTLDHWFKDRWPAEKIVHLPRRDPFEVYHLSHGPFSARWAGQLGSDQSRWRYAGQSDIHGEAGIVARLDPPCWVRRVEVRGAVEETRFYDGRPIAWSTPAMPGVLYSFSMRKET